MSDAAKSSQASKPAVPTGMLKAALGSGTAALAAVLAYRENATEILNSIWSHYDPATVQHKNISPVVRKIRAGRLGRKADDTNSESDEDMLCDTKAKRRAKAADAAFKTDMSECKAAGVCFFCLVPLVGSTTFISSDKKGSDKKEYKSPIQYGNVPVHAHCLAPLIQCWEAEQKLVDEHLRVERAFPCQFCHLPYAGVRCHECHPKADRAYAHVHCAWSHGYSLGLEDAPSEDLTYRKLHDSNKHKITMVCHRHALSSGMGTRWINHNRAWYRNEDKEPKAKSEIKAAPTTAVAAKAPPKQSDQAKKSKVGTKAKKKAVESESDESDESESESESESDSDADDGSDTDLGSSESDSDDDSDSSDDEPIQLKKVKEKSKKTKVTSAKTKQTNSTTPPNSDDESDRKLDRKHVTPTHSTLSTQFKADLEAAKAKTKAKLEAETTKLEMAAKAKLKVATKAKLEAESKANLEAESKAKHEAETKAKHEAESKAKLEAESKAKLEAESKAKEAAEFAALAAELAHLEKENERMANAIAWSLPALPADIDAGLDALVEARFRAESKSALTSDGDVEMTSAADTTTTTTTGERVSSRGGKRKASGPPVDDDDGHAGSSSPARVSKRIEWRDAKRPCTISA